MAESGDGAPPRSPAVLNCVRTTLVHGEVHRERVHDRRAVRHRALLRRVPALARGSTVVLGLLRPRHLLRLVRRRAPDRGRRRRRAQWPGLAPRRAASLRLPPRSRRHAPGTRRHRRPPRRSGPLGHVARQRHGGGRQRPGLRGQFRVRPRRALQRLRGRPRHRLHVHRPRRPGRNAAARQPETSGSRTGRSSPRTAPD